MGIHEDYGKDILRRASKGKAELAGPTVEIDYGTPYAAKVDGTYQKCVAIEIESRVNKQVRGAVLDLICHRYPKKLLVLLPAYINVSTCPVECRNILERFVDKKDFQVVVLAGDGHQPSPRTDVRRVADSLSQLAIRIE